MNIFEIHVREKHSCTILSDTDSTLSQPIHIIRTKDISSRTTVLAITFIDNRFTVMAIISRNVQ